MTQSTPSSSKSTAPTTAAAPKFLPMNFPTCPAVGVTLATPVTVLDAPFTIISLTPFTVTPMPFATVEATRQPDPPAKVDAFAELMNITGDSAIENDSKTFKNFE